jgi:hypothetical protein
VWCVGDAAFLVLEGIWTGVVGVVGLVFTLVVVRGGLEGDRLEVSWEALRLAMAMIAFGSDGGIGCTVTATSLAYFLGFRTADGDAGGIVEGCVGAT